MRFNPLHTPSLFPKALHLLAIPNRNKITNSLRLVTTFVEYFFLEWNTIIVPLLFNFRNIIGRLQFAKKSRILCLIVSNVVAGLLSSASLSVSRQTNNIIKFKLHTSSWYWPCISSSYWMRSGQDSRGTRRHSRLWSRRQVFQHRIDFFRWLAWIKMIQ